MWIAAQITILGMGLVFGAIILLWWMMAALTALTAEKAQTPLEPEPAPAADADSALKMRAAAVAVALALAEQGSSNIHPLPEPPTSIVSAWQLGMRTRQMYEKGGR